MSLERERDFETGEFVYHCPTHGYGGEVPACPFPECTENPEWFVREERQFRIPLEGDDVISEGQIRYIRESRVLSIGAGKQMVWYWRKDK
jgi:hypothetical protein